MKIYLVSAIKEEHQMDAKLAQEKKAREKALKAEEEQTSLDI